MKHLILNGMIAPFASADAEIDFIELDEEQEAFAQSVWAAGGAVTADLAPVLEAQLVEDANLAIQKGFAESKYGAAKIEASVASGEAVMKSLKEAAAKMANGVNKK
jgi:hypothetical protein